MIRKDKIGPRAPKELISMFKLFEISKIQSNQFKDRDLLQEINKRLGALELIHSVLDTIEQSDKRKPKVILAHEDQDSQDESVRSEFEKNLENLYSVETGPSLEINKIRR